MTVGQLISCLTGLPGGTEVKFQAPYALATGDKTPIGNVHVVGQDFDRYIVAGDVTEDITEAEEVLLQHS